MTGEDILTMTIGNKKASDAFRAIVESLGRDDVTDILLNWEDCELGEDANSIIQYAGRDRDYSHGKEGGKTRISKKVFLAWLLGDGPFDAGVYGPRIREDSEWVRKIESARVASGLQVKKLA